MSEQNIETRKARKLVKDTCLVTVLSLDDIHDRQEANVISQVTKDDMALSENGYDEEESEGIHSYLGMATTDRGVAASMEGSSPDARRAQRPAGIIWSLGGQFVTMTRSRNQLAKSNNVFLILYYIF